MRPPPDNHGEIGRWRLDEPSQLAHLRAALRDAVGDDPPDLSERILVVATELAGNALRHGCPPVTVALRADGHLVVDVADGARTDLPVIDAARSPGAGGLGLQLAERLAEDVGWYPDPAGKHVWAAFLRRG